MSLFEERTFIAHAGGELRFKIECDALTDDDLHAIASIIRKGLKFGEVHGVPRGGQRLANILEPYCTEGPLLIVDDVLTTGTSMEEARKQFADTHPDIKGVVIFARKNCPHWVRSIFQMSLWASYATWTTK